MRKVLGIYDSPKPHWVGDGFPVREILVLGGEPIDEPVAWHSLFVMNTRDELVQAIDDFNNGRFGAMPAA